MYKELLSMAEANGKVVQGITSSMMLGQVVIAFKDGTFLALGITHDYDDVCTVARCLLDFEDFGRAALIESGIVSQEELRRELKRLEEERAQVREDAERRRYKQLQAKFGKA